MAPNPQIEASAPKPKTDPAEWELPDSDPTPLLKPAPSAGATGGKPAVERESPPPAPVHSTRILRLAKHVGISEQEIAGMGREELIQEVQAAQMEHNQIAIERRMGESLDHQRKPAPPPAAEVDHLGWQEEWEEDDDDNPGQKVKRRLPLEGKDGLAKPLVNALRKLAKDNADLRKKVEGGEKEKAARSQNQQIDDAFAALPKKYLKLFGDKPIDELPKEQKSIRRRVWHTLQADPPTENVGVKEAILQRVEEMYSALVQDETEEAGYDTEPAPRRAAPREPAPAPRPPKPRSPETGRYTQEEWDAGALLPTTQRKGAPEPKGRARAIQHVARLQREAGNLNGDHSEEYDELPD